ncbi:MAG: hypothetical protein QG635_2120 [Bacteroidota bacterium]|nr:hypothetical protein [Bacteroidota bacterium]
MRPGRFFWGTLLVLLGMFFLLRNLGIEMNLGWAVNLWPLIIVLWGLSLLKYSIRYRSLIASALALVIVLVIAGMITHSWWHWGCNRGMDWCSDDSYNSSSTYSNNLTIPLDSTCRLAKFNFDGGAGRFVMGDTTSMLFNASTGMGSDNLSLNSSLTDSVYNIDLSFDINNFVWHRKNGRNETLVRFNPNLPWEMNLNIGASKMECDFSKLNVRQLDLDAGAASIDIKLGKIADTCHVEIDAGATSVDILLPVSVGCSIDAETGMSSNNFDNFDKSSDDIYYSNNYNNTKQKVFIKISGGVSSFKVKRY